MCHKTCAFSHLIEILYDTEYFPSKEMELKFAVFFKWQPFKKIQMKLILKKSSSKNEWMNEWMNVWTLAKCN